MSENKSLVAIVHQTLELQKMLVESSGEINDSFEQALTVNSKELATKVDGYVEVIEHFKSMQAHYKSRSEYFKEISDQCKNAIERLKNNIEFAMRELKVDEIKGVDMRFTLSKTVGSLNITDLDMIPVEYKREEMTTVIDNKGIKDALLSGKNVPGAELISGTSLKQYANTKDKKSKTKEVV